MGITEREWNKIIGEIAKKENVSVAFIKAEIEKAMETANWSALSLDRKPDMLEGINIIAEEVRKQ